jgi:very-short-patch-repair endonuclease
MRDGENLKAAKSLRKNAPLPEQKLWAQLRNRQLEGFKFRRQVPIGPFIADFVCIEKMLVVELDGWTHSTAEELAYDHRRTAFLNSEGYRVVRFDNIESMQGMDEMLTMILDELHK